MMMLPQRLLWGHTSTPLHSHFSTVAGSLEMTPAELEEMALVRKKTLMRFGPNDLLEVKFPEGPLRNAAARLVKSKVWNVFCVACAYEPAPSCVERGRRGKRKV